MRYIFVAVLVFFGFTFIDNANAGSWVAKGEMVKHGLQESKHISKLKTAKSFAEINRIDLTLATKSENIQDLLKIAEKNGKISFFRRVSLGEKYGKIDKGDYVLLKCLKGIGCDLGHPKLLNLEKSSSGQPVKIQRKSSLIVGKSGVHYNKNLREFSAKNDQQHRNELKRNMKKKGIGNNKKKGSGQGNRPCKDGFQAHHIIPVGVVTTLTKNGILRCGSLIDPKSLSYVNGGSNGICLSQTKAPYKSPVQHSGSHGNYDNQIKDMLRGKSCSETKKIQQCIRSRLEKNTTVVKINKLNLSKCKI